MRNLLLTTLTFTAILCPAVQAQTASPGPSQREREDFEPVGGRVGSFVLHPNASAQIEYDDNVLAIPDGEEDDVVLTVRGGMSAESLWQRHKVEASAYVQQTVHAQFSSENSLEGGGRVEGLYDISRDTSLRVIAAGDALAENRSSITSVEEAREPTRYRRFEGLASLAHDFDPLQLVVDVQATSLGFDDAEAANGDLIEQDFRDSLYLRSSASLAYDVSPRIAVLARGQLDRLNYTENNTLSTPFDRDTTGYSLEGGVRFELTSLIFGEVRAGVLHRETDDPALPSRTGVSFGARVDWDVTTLTRIQFFADRQVEEGGSSLTSGNLRGQGRIEVQHELLRNLILKGGVRVAHIETLGQFENSAFEYEVDFEATYLLDRNVRLFARAQRFERSSDSAFFRDFARDRISIGARVVF